MEDILEDNNQEQEENKEENKDNKKEENQTENKIEEAMDVLMEKEQKEGANKFPDENLCNRVISYIKKIKLVENSKREEIFSKEDLENYNESYGIFYCDKNNGIDGQCCQPEQLFCIKCMKNNQKMYNLRPNYLINDRLRVCTFKRNKIYCNGKFTKNENKDGIIYSFFYRCGHSGYCDACKRMNKYIDKYFDTKLLENLRERDNKLLQKCQY